MENNVYIGDVSSKYFVCVGGMFIVLLRSLRKRGIELFNITAIDRWMPMMKKKRARMKAFMLESVLMI